MKLERQSLLRNLLTVTPKLHQSPDKQQYYQHQQQFINKLYNNVSIRRSKRFNTNNSNMVNSIYNITRSLTTSDDPIYIRPMHFSQWNPSDVKPTVDIPSSDTIGIRQSPSNDSGFDSSPSSPGDLTISSSIDNHQLKSSPSISSLSSVSSSSSQCRWMNCTLVFDNDTLLFDHVMKTHILILKPTSIKTRNTTGQRSTTVSINCNTNRCVDDHPIKCRWSQCGMRLQRGDNSDKRYAWLEEHFATRHAGRAQPYPCLIDGCTQRFSFKRSLEDHLRIGHVDQRRNGSVSCKRNMPYASSMAVTGTDHDVSSSKRAKRRIDCLPFFVPPIDPKMDFYDVGTSQLIAERLAYASDCSTTARLMLIVNNRIDGICGAKYRKQYRNFPIHTIVTTTKSTNKKDNDQYRNASTILRKLLVKKHQLHRK